LQVQEYKKAIIEFYVYLDVDEKKEIAAELQRSFP